MANEFARNIQDALVNPVATTLFAAASTTVNSAVIDLGADTYKNERFELEAALPALSTTIAPDTRTVTVSITSSATSGFGTVARTLASKVYTGASGAGISAATLRCRPPSDCERYVRMTIVSGASTTDASALSATLTGRF